MPEFTPVNVSTMRLPRKPVLTLAVARLAIAAAETEAANRGVSTSIAVLDDGGHLLHFVRMDGVHVGTVEVAAAKARTAILFKKSTQIFAEAVASGATALASLPGMLPFPGGVPFLADGDLLFGAIGVSGAAPDVDAMIAEAGAKAVATGDAS